MHRDGDYHRAVHTWIYAESTGQLLLQLRSDCKESWPGLWDISSAGHISAGDTSLVSARLFSSFVLCDFSFVFYHQWCVDFRILMSCWFRRRELEEEIGISLPDDAFELIFVFLEEGFGKLELIN